MKSNLFTLAILFATVNTGVSAQILETPDYSGDISIRSTLTGDWNGSRTQWAENDFHFELDSIAIYQNVADGGIDEDDGLQGSTDLVLQLDTGKAGLWPGGLFKLRAETRYGESVVRQAGATSLVNLDATFPNVSGRFDDEVWSISELTATQFISEKFGVFLGLINTLDGDANVLAGSPRSRDKFRNGAFLYSPVEIRSTPTVTLGAGAVFIPNEKIFGTLAVFNSEESAGFNPFEREDGTTVSTEWTVQHELGGLAGAQTFGFLYAFDRELPILAMAVYRFPILSGVKHRRLTIKPGLFITTHINPYKATASAAGGYFCAPAFLMAM